MSLYYVQKLLYELNRNPQAQDQYKADMDTVLSKYVLTDEEIYALKKPDIGLLYVLGVNGQILMHYAALCGIAWFDYLEAMRNGVVEHGPVRAGLYAMTGEGESFTNEEKSNEENH